MPARLGGVDARLVALAGLGGLSWGLVWAVLAPYLRSLGYSGAEYGAMGGVAVLSGTVFTLLGGFLSDRVGARPVVAVSLALSSAALLLVSTGVRGLVAAGFMLNGAAGGLSWASEQALVARSSRDERLHYAFSYVSAASTIGGAAGSFLGWAPVLYSNATGTPLVEAYAATLRYAAALPLLGIPLVAGVREALPQRRASPLAAVRGLGRRFYQVAALEMLIGFGAAMSIHNIDYYFVAKYGVTSAELGSVIGLQQLVMAALMALMPGLADRHGGALRVYLAVSAPSIPLLVAMTFTNDYLVAAALYLVRSVLMNVANPLFTAFVMARVPPEHRGAASAFLALSWTVPAGGGRAVGGYLLDIDLELPLRLTALLYTASLAGLALLFKNDLRRGAQARMDQARGKSGEEVAATQGAAGA